MFPNDVFKISKQRQYEKCLLYKYIFRSNLAVLYRNGVFQYTSEKINKERLLNVRTTARPTPVEFKLVPKGQKESRPNKLTWAEFISKQASPPTEPKILPLNYSRDY